jgi:hypothetical protein
MQKAEEDRAASIADLQLREPQMTETDYWKEYNGIQEVYTTAY